MNTGNVARLCKCVQCDIILIDENNQNSTPELPIPDDAQNMVQLSDESGYYWGCPMCLSDENLTSLAPHGPSQQEVDNNLKIAEGNFTIGTYVGTHKIWESESDWHYHDQWDWIMPVVKTLFFDERIDAPGIEFEDKINQIEEALKTCEVINVFHAVVESINWINENELPQRKAPLK